MIRLQKLVKRRDIVAAVFQAVVEVLAAQQAGMKIQNASIILAHDDDTMKAIQSTKITVASSGEPKLVYSDENSKTLILESLEDEEVTEDESTWQPGQTLDAVNNAVQAGSEIAQGPENEAHNTSSEDLAAENTELESERVATDAPEIAESDHGEMESMEKLSLGSPDEGLMIELIYPSLSGPEMATLHSIPLSDRKFKFFVSSLPLSFFGITL